MVDGKRRYKSDRKDHKVSVKLSEKDMDILKAALNRTGMTASAYIRELIRTGGNIDTSYPEDRARAIRKPDANVEVMNPNNNQNEIGRQKEQAYSARKQETDVKGKSEFVEPKEKEPMVKVGWIVRRISELGGYENVSDSVKADIFGFDIADVSGSIRLFSDVMKRLGIKLDGDGLYEEFQRIYDEAVSRDVGKDKAEDKMWNRGRGR